MASRPHRRVERRRLCLRHAAPMQLAPSGAGTVLTGDSSPARPSHHGTDHGLGCGWSLARPTRCGALREWCDNDEEKAFALFPREQEFGKKVAGNRRSLTEHESPRRLRFAPMRAAVARHPGRAIRSRSRSASEARLNLQPKSTKIWICGFVAVTTMKTTVEVPDELYRKAKAEAALRGRKLKDLVEEGLRLVLDAPRKEPGAADPRRPHEESARRG